MKKPEEYYRKASRQWLLRAQDDIAWTKHNIQVAEKSLKAFLRSRKREIDKKFKTHHLTNLLNQCREIDQKFGSLEKSCRILNEYYAPTRYPKILGLEFRGYSKKQAEEAVELAEEIFEFVREKVK